MKKRGLKGVPIFRRLILLAARRDRALLQRARQDYALSVMTGFGNFLQSWGVVERIADTLIAGYFPHAVDKIRQNGLPSSLGDKVKFLIVMANDERLSPDLKPKFKHWASEIGRLSHFRHLVVHGFFSKVGPLVWEGQMLTLKGSDPTFVRKRFTNEQLNEEFRKIGLLSRDMAEWINPRLFGAEWKNHIS